MAVFQQASQFKQSRNTAGIIVSSRAVVNGIVVCAYDNNLVGLAAAGDFSTEIAHLPHLHDVFLRFNLVSQALEPAFNKSGGCLQLPIRDHVSLADGAG